MAKRLDLPQEQEGGSQGNGQADGQDDFRQSQGFNQGSEDRYTDAGKRASQTSPPRTSKVIKLILWAVLIIVAFPVFLGVGGGLLGLAAGVLGILTAILVGLGVTTFAVLMGGIVMLPYGVFHMFSHPLDGLMTSGTGLILLGAGALCLALSVLFYGRFVPFVIRSIVNGLSRLLHRRR